MLEFQDPVQKKVGEIRVNYRTKCFANFGSPESVSLYYFKCVVILFVALLV